MTAAGLLALFVAFVTGLLLLCALWPTRPFVTSQLGLAISLAVGVGLGASSCTFFLALVLFDARCLGVAVLDTALLVFALSLYFLMPATRQRSLPARAASPATVGPVIRRTLAGTLVVALAAASASFLVMVLQRPHGGWDAWAIWNLRARFLFRGGAYWREAFGPQLLWSHPDYPLLIPGTVARVWTYMQVDTVLVPISVSLLFALATIGLMYASLALLRTRTQALLAAVCLAASPVLTRYAAEQYADVPIAYFFLATLVLFACHDRFAPAQPGFLLCAGLMAGLAAWTKNEGLSFLLVLVLVRTAMTRCAGARLRRELLPFALGACPILVVLSFFKFFLAPGTDLLWAQGAATTGRLTDFTRYAQVVRTLWDQCLHFGQGAPIVLLVYRVLAGRTADLQSRRATSAVAATLTLMGVGFFMVYILTPYDLRWHLATSLDRLIVQLWPSLIFVTFLTTTSIEESVMRSVRPLGARAGHRALTPPLQGR